MTHWEIKKRDCNCLIGQFYSNLMEVISGTIASDHLIEGDRVIKEGRIIQVWLYPETVTAQWLRLFCSLPAWVGSVGLAFIFSLGPLTGSLVDRFGCRITAFVGGISCVSGLLLSSLATSIAILYVTYSVLFGFGSSCMFVSCYVVTSLYFNKRQSIATGIIASGSGIGVLAVAPILQVLLDNFQWRKTYRITAGIFSVVCFLCLTFDPTVVKTGREEREGEEENIESENLQEQNDVKKKRWFVDCSVFKNKRFVVLTLSAILYNLGHNTPRLHLVSC